MTPEEFTEQLKKHQGAIYNTCESYCASMDRDDLFQDIVLETWRTIRKFKGECKFNTWIARIARNVCIDKLRRQKTQPKIVATDLKDFEEIIGNSNNYSEIVSQLREAIKYETVMNNLDDADRSLFEMHLFGLSYKEISQQIGVSETALRVKIHRIESRLKLRYGKSSLK